MEKKSEYEQISVICYGARITGPRSAPKESTALMPCDEHQNQTAESYSLFSKCTGMAAGCVYNISGRLDSDGTLMELKVHGAEFIGQVIDSKLNAEIRATDRANTTALQAQRAQRKAERSNDAILECLAPLREAYRKTSSAGRLALDVRVLNYIHNQLDI